MATSLAFGAPSTTSYANQSEQFPEPFLDAASLAFPTTIQDALKYCEYIIMSNGPYREALGRVLSYFLTDIEISSTQKERVGREEKQKYLDFLYDTLGIRKVLMSVGLDMLVYGNSFTSVLVPFRRYLGCKKCGIELPLKKIYGGKEFNFQWTNFEFVATCPKCHYSGPWRHVDRRSGEHGDIKVKRWSPHEMEILWDAYTDDTQYIWKIPDDYRNMVKRGHLHHLERVSWEIVQAVKNNQALLFDKEVVYHMKEEALAGIRNRGWGLSRVLNNFRQAWYYQVLHRYNEAIALDYVIPFRVITPMPRPGQAGEVNDPVLSMNLGSFTSRVTRMIRERRRNPAQWNVLPFPVEYKALGGDATQLAPKDLLELGLDVLLTSAGVPVELYKGSLSVQAAPAALRLFEANWSHLVHNLNRFLSTLVDKISQIMSWEPVTATLQRVTHADDLNRQMAKLQLMMGQQISKTTGLGSIGVQYREELRRQLEEQRMEAEETQQAQEEMEAASTMDQMAAPEGMAGAGGGGGGGGGGQFGMPQFQGMPGAMPGGGMPPVQTGGGPSQQQGPMGQPTGAYGGMQQFMAQVGSMPTDTPEQLLAKAETLADQIMAMPQSQMQSYLINLKSQDRTMWLLVRSIVEQRENQLKTQGKNQLQAQLYKQAEAIDGRQLRAIELS